MAEIDIERRRMSPWPWIIVGLVVLAVLAFLLLRGRGDDEVEPGPVVDTTTAVTPAPTTPEPIPPVPLPGDTTPGSAALDTA